MNWGFLKKKIHCFPYFNKPFFGFTTRMTFIAFCPLQLKTQKIPLTQWIITRLKKKRHKLRKFNYLFDLEWKLWKKRGQLKNFFHCCYGLRSWRRSKNFQRMCCSLLLSRLLLVFVRSSRHNAAAARVLTSAICLLDSGSSLRLTRVSGFSQKRRRFSPSPQKFSRIVECPQKRMSNFSIH